MTADVELLPLPEPYGYLRELDGSLQMSIGPVRPADRAGGYATPWAAMYDSGRVRANVARHTAAQAAEIKALRADMADYMRIANVEATRAERLAEALKGLTDATIRRVYLPEKVFRAALAVAKDVLLQEQE